MKSFKEIDLLPTPVKMPDDVTTQNLFDNNAKRHKSCQLLTSKLKLVVEIKGKNISTRNLKMSGNQRDCQKALQTKIHVCFHVQKQEHCMIVQQCLLNLI